ncbi:MAG: SpoIIIAH-like family protein, partial [Lachnospiraceae bacterium]|nr:SpoIIIAH-like family protein [Lachnospiraceae bacterium]
AVFTSVMLQSGYFSNAKLNREQMRARSKETLMSVVSDSTVADELKQEAIDTIIALTARAENENAAEILLEAKGYEGVVVSISDTEVDVVVNAESITEQQIAQIEDIVSRKTGISADGIVITTVVMED